MGTLWDDGDGTGRPLRKVQVEALKWYESTRCKNKVIIAACGSGKSAIARAIQRRYGGAYLTPNNLLIEQLRGDYPEVNYLIGKDHYMCCKEPTISCVDRKEIFNKRCPDCHYIKCVDRAVKGEDTFFNPLSYYYMRKRDNWVFPNVVIVDEAHQLLESIKTLVSEKLSKLRYRWPAYESEVELFKWMKKTILDLRDRCRVIANPTKVKHLIQMHDKLERIYLAVMAHPNEFKIYTEPNPEKSDDTLLVIEPIRTPREFIKSFLGRSDVLLMSATMPDHLIKEVFGDEPYEVLELESPIPAKNRPVVYAPPPYRISSQTRPAAIASWINRVLAQFPGENAIVHVSYTMAKKLKDFFPEALFNTSENKKATLRRFRKEGGLWIASGCAEGIDLPGDICRVNIIPQIIKADLSSIAVLKSRALMGGEMDYNVKALIQLQQQVGRSTRAEDDRSVIVIGDSTFKEMFFKYKSALSQAFKESIVWDLDYANVGKIKERK